MRTSKLCFYILVCTGFAFPAAAMAAPSNMNKAAMNATLDTIVGAWDRADAKAIAAVYADDGDLIIPDGTVLAGKQNIEAFYSSVFAHGYAGSTSTAQIVRDRKLDSRNYVVDGTWSINAIKHVGKPDTTESGIFTGIFVRTHGHWQLAALREQTTAASLRSGK